MARKHQPHMTYYSRLLHSVNICMNAHPQSTVVMDAKTFKVLATARDAERLKEKPHPLNSFSGSVVVGKSKPNHVRILPIN